ncbi:5-methylcytosine restriction system specificity protein McrC [Streptomyces candidus]|uniref:5-methylcytosine-specific restriction endonuclease McrBC regulatory subunit McrC n=1 Tax=Streptomyces candidus TaxID=67283 RepID=A0A7X0HG55_9ACTN|nr:hypothetical protein [Streptomyces candidus]MBB6435697.1 5-methylcytosine-specific restriction endonuclease McrBC regulatory subunit McrC [Streptomyces candidus]GHH46484.1 hypothetical protein GCM10018773_37520 [Streptomyces candidus]
MRVRTYGRLQLTESEIGMPVEQAMQLPWARSGVATLRRTRLGAELEIGPYAGTIAFNDKFSVTIDELVPGTVAACLAISSSGRKQNSQKSSHGDRVAPIVAIALEFLRTLEGEILGSLRKEYVTVTSQSNRPRGRISVRETVLHLWAKGRTDHVVTRSRVLTEDTPVNRYLLAASIRAERLLRHFPDERRSIQKCIHALSGAEVYAQPSFPMNLSEADQSLLRSLRIAEALLSGVPFRSQQHGEAPFSAWVNVDRVFEEAVRETCHRVAPASATVTDGKSQRIKIFHARDGEPSAIAKRADPDIVVQHHGKIGLLDAKYRISGERVTEDELYQLIAHIGAFSADAGALVAPALNAPPGVRRLGRINGGCTVDVIAVDPTDPDAMASVIASWISTL